MSGGLIVMNSESILIDLQGYTKTRTSLLSSYCQMVMVAFYTKIAINTIKRFSHFMYLYNRYEFCGLVLCRVEPEFTVDRVCLRFNGVKVLYHSSGPVNTTFSVSTCYCNIQSA